MWKLKPLKKRRTKNQLAKRLEKIARRKKEKVA